MLQRLFHVIYPPHCILCETLTEVDFALCGPCWVQTPFIGGVCCDHCGQPLLGPELPSVVASCDGCMKIKRPWSKGRAALVYKDNARRLVLSLKHGDRTDLVRVVAPWMARAGQDILQGNPLLVPVPLHRFRLIKRKYNQAALLAHQLAKVTGLDLLVDGLHRSKRTAPLDRHTSDQRFASLDGAIEPSTRQAHMIKGRKVVLIDDVMTSGATFAAATQACFAAGADDVCVLALARVAKDA